MKLRWTQRALADLQRLADHIAADHIAAEDRPLAAQAFVAAVADKVARLALFPLLGRQGRLDDARELIVHNNHLVSYRLRADQVQVLQLWRVARERRA